jgi:hypothetical protein
MSLHCPDGLAKVRGNQKQQKKKLKKALNTIVVNSKHGFCFSLLLIPFSVC